MHKSMNKMFDMEAGILYKTSMLTGKQDTQDTTDKLGKDIANNSLNWSIEELTKLALPATV